MIGQYHAYHAYKISSLPLGWSIYHYPVNLMDSNN